MSGKTELEGGIKQGEWIVVALYFICVTLIITFGFFIFKAAYNNAFPKTQSEPYTSIQTVHMGISEFPDANDYLNMDNLAMLTPTIEGVFPSGVHSYSSISDEPLSHSIALVYDYPISVTGNQMEAGVAPAYLFNLFGTSTYEIPVGDKTFDITLSSVYLASTTVGDFVYTFRIEQK